MTTPSNEHPSCVGFIMDGNRRFATSQGRSALEGHIAGESVFVDSLHWVQAANIPHAVYYAFSTENWRRSEAEVAHLMQLFEQFMSRMIDEVHVHQVQVKVVGQKTAFSTKLQNVINELEDVSAQYDRTTIWVALSYGGRAEIVSAVNAAIAQGEMVDEERFAQLLWTADMPDPDLIIRTGGEQRLSNFLPWQSVYSELYFTDTYWPAFTKEEFMRIVDVYASRQRRKGA